MDVRNTDHTAANATSQKEGQESETSQEHIFGGGPPARLYVPSDWFDFLSDGEDVDAARRRYETLIGRVFPSATADQRQEIIKGLMLWREQMWSKGMLSHGIVNVPANGTEPPIFWNVFAIAMKLPAASPELNSTSLLSQLIGHSDLSFARHVETFPTDMGVGLGLFGRQATPQLGTASASPQDDDVNRQQHGIAAALSYTPGAEYGLAVVGVSMDPEQDQDVGRLVALIAGRSTFVTPETEDA
ncbi:hypothetical protein ACTWP5_23530 [Streptomyces sp. 4N509B]|uniref:hypothetical protein n=1 Tax=Streptomyces sp. 4N509B TaxID=3457413 RepID=UPI003FCEFC79